MFDDEPLAIARILRASERALIVVDHRLVRGAPAPEEVDVSAMASQDSASWEDWAILVRRIRVQADRSWLPVMLSWFSSPFVVTSLVGREAIRAGATPPRTVEACGAIERLVCTGACGSAPPSIANDDLNESGSKLAARFGRCRLCRSPVVPSIGHPSRLHSSVEYANDRALDLFRTLQGRAIALLVTREGMLDAQGVRIAQASGATMVRPAGLLDEWVNKVDHALVSLSWGGPAPIPIAVSRS